MYDDDTAGHVWALFGCMRGASTPCVCQACLWGIVVGHRIVESREGGLVSIGWVGGRIETDVRDRINLENSVADGIHGNRGIRRYGVTDQRNSLLAKDFSGVFCA